MDIFFQNSPAPGNPRGGAGGGGGAQGGARANGMIAGAKSVPKVKLEARNDAGSGAVVTKVKVFSEGDGDAVSPGGKGETSLDR